MSYIGSPAAPTISTVSDGTVTSNKLADDAVTSAKLDTNIAVDGNLTVDTNTLYVDSTNNNVGIGTSSPDSSNKLQVSGDIGLDWATDKFIGMKFGTGGSYKMGLMLKDSSRECKVWSQSVDSDDKITFYTGSTPSERMRIDSSGNVGIGTTSMTRFFNLYDTSGNATTAYIKNTSASGGSGILCYNDSGQAATFQLNGSSNSSYAGANTLNIGSVTNNTVAFLENNTERMRITSGNLLVGTTNTNNNTEDGLRLYGGAKYASFTRNGGAPLALVRRSSGGEIQEFFYNSTKVGTVSISTTNTSYNTSSDYRLKENVIEVTDGINRVKLLKPSRFNFIADPDTTVDGFLAHEVQDVVPEAITGTKDAVDADGNPEYQGIDQSKLVPLLTAALQEAITKIESLEARVATLESA